MFNPFIKYVCKYPNNTIIIENATETIIEYPVIVERNLNKNNDCKDYRNYKWWKFWI
jgi:hypothetical protein